MNDEEFHFLSSFNGFHTEQKADVLAEFTRLALSRNWKAGSKTYKKHFRELERIRNSKSSDIALALEQLQLSDGGVQISSNFESLRQDFKLTEVGISAMAEADLFKSAFHKYISDQFSTTIGTTEVKLSAMQTICCDMGHSMPLPPTTSQCKKFLNTKFVNIYDYVKCKRDQQPVKPIFTSKVQFRKYTRGDRIFPLEAAKSNPLLKALLTKLSPATATKK